MPKKLTTNEFIRKSRRIHGNKYDYSKSIYKDSKTKIVIGCKKHGNFLKYSNKHFVGQGCEKCTNEILSKKFCLTTIEFIKKAKKIHGNKYDYTKTDYRNTQSKVIISCKKHGDFKQTPNNHLTGYGCIKCCHKISNPEVDFLNYVKIQMDNRQLYIRPYKIDGYDPKTNTIYEFLGDYWHGNPKKFGANDINKKCKLTFGKLYTNTIDKFKKLKQTGYNIRYIWELDWKKFKQKINKHPKIKCYGKNSISI